MRVIDLRLPKVCHAPVGSVIRLPDLSSGTPIGPYYLVCAFSDPKKRPGRKGLSIGLYDDERDLFLVNIENGEAISMPHLSSRAEQIESAKLLIGDDNVR
jgi:hypothetical protein